MARMLRFAAIVLLVTLLCQKIDGRATFPLPSRVGRHIKPLQTSRPYNIANGGSSGEVPEETALAYLRAIDEGADFLKAEVQASADGILYCFHDLILDKITNVAQFPEYKNRTKTYEVDGKNVTGRFGVNFTISELTSLTVYQRYEFRDQRYNGQYSILTFEEFISIALNAPRIVGIYVEIKNPVFTNKHVTWADGKKFEDRVVETLHKYGYYGDYRSKYWKKQPVFIQSFAPSSLIYMSNLTDSPKVLAIGDYYSRTEDTNLTFWTLTSDGYLEYISNYVIGIALPKETIAPSENNYLITPNDLIAKAHACNIQVHSYTYLNEHEFLRWDFNVDPYKEYAYFINILGVDGLITDFPGSLFQYQQWTSDDDDDSLPKTKKHKGKGEASKEQPRGIFDKIASVFSSA